MAASSAVAPHLFVRHLRWLLLGCVLMMCVGLDLAIVWSRKEDPAATGVGNAILSIQEFHTLLYDSGLRLRVSGDSLTVSPLKLLGPFRLGIAHSLTASAVTVETFPDTSLRSQSNLHPPSFDRFLVSLKPSFNRFLASLIPGEVSIVIAHAECGPLRIVQHQGDQQTVIFAAATCHTSLRSAKVLCKDGVIRTSGNDVPFHELLYDGRNWKLRTPLGQREVVEVGDFSPSSSLE